MSDDLSVHELIEDDSGEGLIAGKEHDECRDHNELEVESHSVHVTW